MRRIAPLALVAAAALSLAACGGGGATSETQVTNTTVSTGQQLIDLKAALDAGVITPEEYASQRKRILAQ
ncbi:MAG: SHOCT domain-containing protein [Rubrimonas sp.]|uniref:SHOCT domain-containing protein n=1 Tax=Rubrimonas sp. TaxID=2036015 RepID=UPI002FDCDFA7